MPIDFSEHIEIPETLFEALQLFATGDNALRVLVQKRWPNGVTCPLCKGKDVTFMPRRALWQYRMCRKQFSVKVGTIFEDSPISLAKWLSAMWLIANAKNGISSCELHRSLGVTQKTAWFMLHRIRLATHNGTIEKMQGIVEADETFVGPNADFMHKDVKKKKGIVRLPG